MSDETPVEKPKRSRAKKVVDAVEAVVDEVRGEHAPRGDGERVGFQAPFLVGQESVQFGGTDEVWAVDPETGTITGKA